MQLLHIAAWYGLSGVIRRSRYGQFTSVTPAPCFQGSLLSLMLTEGPLGISLQMTVYYYIIPSCISWEKVVTSVKKIRNCCDFYDRIFLCAWCFKTMFPLALVGKRCTKMCSGVKAKMFLKQVKHSWLQNKLAGARGREKEMLPVLLAPETSSCLDPTPLVPPRTSLGEPGSYKWKISCAESETGGVSIRALEGSQTG